VKTLATWVFYLLLCVKYLPDKAKACTLKRQKKKKPQEKIYLDYILDVSYNSRVEKVMLSFFLSFFPFFFFLKHHTKTRHYKENRVKIRNQVKYGLYHGKK